MARKRAEKPLSERSPRERWEARNILHGEPTPSWRKYDPDVHPRDALRYFRERYAEVADPERNVNARGDLRYVVKPVRCPTFAGYAARIGVAPVTIWRWSRQHTEFAEAHGKCKAIQEAFLIEQGTLGALNAQAAIFSLRNLQGWRDKAEVGLSGRVELTFDARDAAA